MESTGREPAAEGRTRGALYGLGVFARAADGPRNGRVGVLWSRGGPRPQGEALFPVNRLGCPLGFPTRVASGREVSGIGAGAGAQAVGEEGHHGRVGGQEVELGELVGVGPAHLLTLGGLRFCG